MGDRQFNTGEPLAYLITWTTYGTWLRGDPRSHHPNKLLVELDRTAMKESAFMLSQEGRTITEQTIVAHCEIRGWTLLAVKARSNHVHAVVAAPSYSPAQVRDQFKAWCTRRLKPTNPDRTRFWTEGGSCRWINGDDDLEAAIQYVNEAQDRKLLDR